MKVKFLKYCPWSYRLTMGQRGRTVKHNEGDVAQVDNIEAVAMIEAGYAEQVKPGRKPTYKPEERKIVKPKSKKKNGDK